MSLLLQIAPAADSLAMASLDLGPLQEPQAVEFTFSTVGWPILAGVILILIVVIAILQIRIYRHDKYRRQALEEWQKVVANEHQLSHCMVLVKRTAIHAFGRDEVGKLAGQEWLQFLDSNAKNVAFQSIHDEVEALIYKDAQPEAGMREAILKNTKNWITTHAAR